MGKCKQLLPVPDSPAVVRCIETILDAGISPLVVVVGAREDVPRAVVGLPVIIARNDAAESDMAASVRVGLPKLQQSGGNTFVCLCDHPIVRTEWLIAMSEHASERANAIVIPSFKGRKGHPTLLPTMFLQEITSLPTLRDVISRHADAVSLLECDDEGTVLDMDTWDDYQRILCKLRDMPH
ncbi:MAG TPA: nucleotidyltransferase family protein [Geobacteraceae bacterium]